MTLHLCLVNERAVPASRQVGHFFGDDVAACVELPPVPPTGAGPRVSVPLVLGRHSACLRWALGGSRACPRRLLELTAWSGVAPEESLGPGALGGVAVRLVSRDTKGCVTLRGGGGSGGGSLRNAPGAPVWLRAGDVLEIGGRVALRLVPFFCTATEATAMALAQGVARVPGPPCVQSSVAWRCLPRPSRARMMVAALAAAVAADTAAAGSHLRDDPPCDTAVTLAETAEDTSPLQQSPPKGHARLTSSQATTPANRLTAHEEEEEEFAAATPSASQAPAATEAVPASTIAVLLGEESAESLLAGSMEPLSFLSSPRYSRGSETMRSGGLLETSGTNQRQPRRARVLPGNNATAAAAAAMTAHSMYVETYDANLDEVLARLEERSHEIAEHLIGPARGLDMESGSTPQQKQQQQQQPLSTSPRTTTMTTAAAAAAGATPKDRRASASTTPMRQRGSGSKRRRASSGKRAPAPPKKTGAREETIATTATTTRSMLLGRGDGSLATTLLGSSAAKIVQRANVALMDVESQEVFFRHK